MALTLALSLTSQLALAIDLKVDRALLNSPIISPASFQRVNFRQAYATTPLVFVLPTADNPDPTQLRVVNVTTTGFDIQQFEPSGEDGATLGTQISYLAITPGVHTLPSGTVIEAGTTNLTNHQGRNVPGASWSTLSFTTTFASTPALLAEIQSNNNGTLNPGNGAVPALTVVTNNVGTTSAQIALEYSETNSGAISTSEQVAYLAITGGTTTTFTDNSANVLALEAFRSANNIPGWDNLCRTVGFSGSYANPMVFAHKITRNGADGGWLRRCAQSGSSAGFTVDEDRAQDSERAHTNETASLVILQAAFDGTLATGAWEADTAFVPGIAASGASLSFTTVVFPVAMSATPMIFTQPTETGANPASVRIRNVTPNGFQIAAVEPPGSPGAHPAMLLDYIAVVPGNHELQDGTQFEAGFVDTSQVQYFFGSTGWTTINFTQTFTQPPALLAQLQTTNNNEPSPDPALPFAPWLTSAVDNLTASSVQVALERSEANDGTVTFAERVGYLAFPANLHGSLTDTLGNTVEYDSRHQVSAVSGYDNGCYAVNYTSAFASVPLAVGHGNTRNGNNGGWARRCAISNSALSQHIDEDQDNDSERSHIPEDISQLAFGQAFDWSPYPDVLLTTSVVAFADGISPSEPKSLPGADMDYTVEVSNQGPGTADADTVTITLAIDSNTELFVGDLDGGGYPVEFNDGATPDESGLTWSPATDISYSNDNGATFSYLPPGGLDYDPAITHLRIAPAGQLAGKTGAPTPQFTVRYRVRNL